MTIRMHTRAIVVVHSHVKKSPDWGETDLSNDVISVSTSKPIKGAGHAQFDLVPRRNYLNYLYPNDVVNIYFDPGDGERGFVRTFFGYIDRVERSEQTDDNGTVSTTFTVICTDVTKALDFTDIYFNPFLHNRKELIDKDFGLSALGGHALRTRGITAHGTPADMVENLLQLLLGFGAQWVLPKSYVKSAKAAITKSREARKQRALSRVPKDLQSMVSEVLGGIEVLGKSQLAIEQEIVKKSTVPVPEGSALFAFDEFMNQFAQQKKDKVKVSSLPMDKLIEHRWNTLASILEKSSTLTAYQVILRQIDTNVSSIIDLMSLSFIEAQAMDGYIVSQAVWQQEGTLNSMLYSFCNEPVNELFFDLRPVVEDAPDGAFGYRYSRDEDELGINVHAYGDMEKTVSGVKYVPAVVMREYPFSTVEGLDLSMISTLDSTLGNTVFGPIFAVDPSNNAQGNDWSGRGEPSDKSLRPRRVLYDYEKEAGVRKIGLSTTAFAENSAPIKHLDVFPIRDTDVINSSIGRSDNDVFNLFAIYANDALMRVYKYLIQEFLPIANPVSIARNGLRVYETNTRYANNIQQRTADEDEDQEEVNNSPKLDTVQIRRNLVRWALLVDHWNQHNAEFLNGSITLRGMPDLRVGYRLDWVDRNESYYVENVSHNWSYPGPMTTTVQVSRGQRNDPFPAYVAPTVHEDFGASFDEEDINDKETAVNISRAEFSIKGGGNRFSTGRLGQFFNVRDTPATVRSTREQSLLSNDENSMDLPGNADHGGVTEYPGHGTASKKLGVADWETFSVRVSDTELERQAKREKAKRRRKKAKRQGTDKK